MAATRPRSVSRTSWRPFWQNKDIGAWSIPKGEYLEGEEPIAVARREFEEETGFHLEGELIPLAEIKQPSGKLVSAWAVEGDCPAANIHSNLFLMEWPRNSGKEQEFPEVDRAEWFPVEEARRRILKGQVGFLDRLAEMLGYSLRLVAGHNDDDGSAPPAQGTLFG